MNNYWLLLVVLALSGCNYKTDEERRARWNKGYCEWAATRIAALYECIDHPECKLDGDQYLSLKFIESQKQKECTNHPAQDHHQ